jgi:hypothetical protein
MNIVYVAMIIVAIGAVANFEGVASDCRAPAFESGIGTTYNSFTLLSSILQNRPCLTLLKGNPATHPSFICSSKRSSSATFFS